MNSNNNKKIYIADDDHAIVDAIKLVLENKGFEVQFTYDGHDVKAMLKYPPDVLLLDIWMSGTDGGTICKMLKKDMETRNIPVILMSAHPKAPTISKECGADGYILKPFSINDLLNKISEVAII